MIVIWNSPPSGQAEQNANAFVLIGSRDVLAVSAHVLRITIVHEISTIEFIILVLSLLAWLLAEV